MHDCFIWHSPLVDELCLTSRIMTLRVTTGYILFLISRSPLKHFHLPAKPSEIPTLEMVSCSWRQNQWLGVRRRGGSLYNFTPFQLPFNSSSFSTKVKPGTFTRSSKCQACELIRNLRNWTITVISFGARIFFPSCLLTT